MDGRCATCKWWGKPADSVHYHGKAGNRRKCDLTQYNNYAYDHPESRAHAYDAEEYYAVLATAPDFGCVQWEAKA